MAIAIDNMLMVEHWKFQGNILITSRVLVILPTLMKVENRFSEKGVCTKLHNIISEQLTMSLIAAILFYMIQTI